MAAQLKLDLGQIAVTARPEVNVREQDLVGDMQRLMEDEALRAERVERAAHGGHPAAAGRPRVRHPRRIEQRALPDAAAAHRHHAEGVRRARRSASGSEISAIGVYAWFHLSALQKATRLASEPLAPAQRQALARAMLADEAFALHFLEDTYAAGHVAGTWGDVSQRKGTHDHYNEAGLEVFTWKGGSESMVLMGDAHMRPEDAERAASAVRISLEQLIDHATGRDLPTPCARTRPRRRPSPMRFDVCKNNSLAAARSGRACDAGGPGAGCRGARPDAGAGARPGTGVDAALSCRGRAVRRLRRLRGRAHASTAATTPSVTDNGVIAGADLSLRAGLGLDGVIGESGDGLVFASIGVRGDTSSSNTLPIVVTRAGRGRWRAAAVRSRFGISTRLRMPFYLIPGDLLLASPLYLFSPETYTGMAVTASNGGLIPWQSGWATRASGASSSCSDANSVPPSTATASTTR